MENENIIYEQPLNEQVRLCLRLEYLFAQVHCCLSKKSEWDIRQAINTLLEISNITDRPDLKNKLGQVLTQHATALSQLEKLPDVDKNKLRDILNKINILLDSLRTNTQKPGQILRENEFLNTIQQRLHTPAGTCNFSLPSYHLWLQQDQEKIRVKLLTWLEAFQQIHEVTKIILNVTRKHTDFKKGIKAASGFYQANLETNINYQMIRISINGEKKLFPEISIGRHRLAIHFFNIDINGRTTQTTNDVIFELACCKI